MMAGVRAPGLIMKQQTIMPGYKKAVCDDLEGSRPNDANLAM